MERLMAYKPSKSSVLYRYSLIFDIIPSFPRSARFDFVITLVLKHGKSTMKLIRASVL
jgi:hypothetical protein